MEDKNYNSNITRVKFDVLQENKISDEALRVYVFISSWLNFNGFCTITYKHIKKMTPWFKESLYNLCCDELEEKGYLYRKDKILSTRCVKDDYLKYLLEKKDYAGLLDVLNYFNID